MYFLVEYNPCHWTSKGPVYRVVAAYRSKWFAKLMLWYEHYFKADPVWRMSFPYMTIKYVNYCDVSKNLFPCFKMDDPQKNWRVL